MYCDRPIRPAGQPIVLVIGLVLAAVFPALANAQAAGSDTGQTYSLTAQQKADILASGTESRVDDSLLQARNGGDGKIHGEMGMMVGTHNTRGIYGNAVIPLGKDATVAIALDHYQTDPGKFRWRHNQGYYMADPNAPY